MEVFKSIFKNIALPVNMLGSMQNIRHEAEGACNELLAARRTHNGDLAHSGIEEKALIRDYEDSRRDLMNGSTSSPGIMGSVFSVLSGKGDKKKWGTSADPRTIGLIREGPA